MVLTTGTTFILDLPILIYATRNWNIHGVESYRARSEEREKKFNIWIDSIKCGFSTSP